MTLLTNSTHSGNSEVICTKRTDLYLCPIHCTYMKSNLDILKNDISREIYNLCLKEGLTRKEISIIRYGDWRPNSILSKIEELEKADYLARDKKGDFVRHRGKCYATRKPFF